MNRLLNYPGIILATIKLLVHLYAILFQGYGMFRDELYMIACAKNPAFGYVDHPPLAMWVLSGWTSIFGDSLTSIRIVPAITGAICVLMIVQIIKRMGGNKLACWLGGTAFLLAPINNGFSSVFNLNSFDLLFWLLGYKVLLSALDYRGRYTNWVLLGLIIGLGMLNKISMSWFTIGLVCFLAVSPYRTLFLRKGIYVAGATALLFFLPYIFWNFDHGFPHLEFIKNASANKYSGITRWDFLTEQMLLENPMMLLLLIASFAFLFSSAIRWRKKSLFIIFLSVQGVLLLKGSVKAEYVAAAYSAVFITGALWIGLVVQTKWQKGLIYLYLTFYFISGFTLMPLAIPLLPAEEYIAYEQALGISKKNSEGKEESQLPQFYADMHYWEEFAKLISEVYQKVPEDKRSETVVWANNYGEAGAIEYYSDRYELPPVLCSHNNYYFWGLEKLEAQTFSSFIILGGNKEGHEESLQQVDKMAITKCKYCMPYENNMPIYFGTDPVEGLSLIEVFMANKHYN